MKKSLRWMCMFICFSMFLLTAGTALVMASPKIKEAEYEGKGVVELEFDSEVQYKNLKISVKDQKGNSYEVKLLKQDDDEIDFSIIGFKTGRTYAYRIKGIRAKGEKKYGSVKGKITIPKTKGGVSVGEIHYNDSEKKVEIEFHQNVQWNKTVRVTITCKRSNHVKKILEKGDNELEVSVDRLKKGVRYNYSISGVRGEGKKKYVTLTGSFVA